MKFDMKATLIIEVKIELPEDITSMLQSKEADVEAEAKAEIEGYCIQLSSLVERVSELDEHFPLDAKIVETRTHIKSIH